MTRTVSHETNWKHILVFLPYKMGEYISTKLRQHGYIATLVHTQQGLLEALMENAHSLAVTSRTNIDTVRNIASLPVINLEVFFHSGPSVDDVLSETKRFDGSAFLRRIEALVDPRPQGAQPA